MKNSNNLERIWKSLLHLVVELLRANDRLSSLSKTFLSLGFLLKQMTSGGLHDLDLPRASNAYSLFEG